MTGYMASVLESNGIGVEIVDANLFGWSIKKTVEKIKSGSFRLIGVRLVYLWENTKEVFDLLLELRNQSVDAHINLYGHYPTFAYKEILKLFPFVDSVTVGEPEYTFLELAKRVVNLEQGGNPDSIKGLALVNRVDQFKPENLINDLDKIPFPDRRYIELEKAKCTTTYILGSRGCYNNCGFCYLNPFYGESSDWRGRSSLNIFNEIKQLYYQKGCSGFYFGDANFFGPGKAGRNRAKELANLIVDNGLQISFGLECRANDIDEDTISLLVKAGLKNIFLGIESGNQATLNYFRKNTSVKINRDAIKTIRKFNIKLNTGFIMFDKNTNLDGIKQNFEFLRDMGLLIEPYTTAHLLFHRQSLFQGTPDYHETESQKDTKPDAQNRLTDPYDYESLFDYKDKRVSAMADITTGFCKKALSIISRNRVLNKPDDLKCECAEPLKLNNNSIKLNKLLIDFFDKTLTSIEKGEFDLTPKSIINLKEKHGRELDLLKISN